MDMNNHKSGTRTVAEQVLMICALRFPPVPSPEEGQANTAAAMGTDSRATYQSGMIWL